MNLSWAFLVVAVVVGAATWAIVRAVLSHDRARRRDADPPDDDAAGW